MDWEGAPLKVGFIDYNLENFRTEKFLGLYRNELKEYGAEVVACYGLVEEPSRAWAAAHGVPWATSPEAVAEQADAVYILAPSNAETHLPLARRVFPTGKPVCMDKTFADTYANAEAIAALAARYSTPLFCSSALRFSVEQAPFMATFQGGPILDCAVVGPGPWSIDGVHTVEPLIGIMGPDVRRLRATGGERVLRVSLEWADGRTGEAVVNNLGAAGRRQGWQVTISSEDAVGSFAIQDGNFYRNFAEETLRFFRSRQTPVPIQETLKIMSILTQAAESCTRATGSPSPEDRPDPLPFQRESGPVCLSALLDPAGQSPIGPCIDLIRPASVGFRSTRNPLVGPVEMIDSHAVPVYVHHLNLDILATTRYILTKTNS